MADKQPGMSNTINHIITYYRKNSDTNYIISNILKYKKHFLLLWEPHIIDINIVSNLNLSIMFDELKRYYKYWYEYKLLKKLENSMFTHFKSGKEFSMSDGFKVKNLLLMSEVEDIKRMDFLLFTYMENNFKLFKFWFLIKYENITDADIEILKVYYPLQRDIWEPYVILRNVF